MAQKKYVSLSKLSVFLDNLSKKFAALSHKHTISDITDYEVDLQLSSSSFNPVANKTLNDEFDAISTAMSALELSIDNKANTSHTHTIDNITSLQSVLNNKVSTDQVYLKTDHGWNVIYDSGEISESVNAFAGIGISGYKKIMVAVKCVNDGSNSSSKNGSIIFNATDGTIYQFPMWAAMFSNGAYTSAALAVFDITDGWIICPNASRNIRATSFLGNDTEGGTADTLSNTIGAVMKCTNTLSTITVSALDMDANYYLHAGSRIIVWGCKT